MSTQKDLATVGDAIELLKKARGESIAIDIILDVLPRLLDALHPSDVTPNKDIDALAARMLEAKRMCSGAAAFLQESKDNAKHRDAIQYFRGAEAAWKAASEKVESLHTIPF